MVSIIRTKRLKMVEFGARVFQAIAVAAIM